MLFLPQIRKCTHHDGCGFSYVGPDARIVAMERERTARA